MSKAQLTLVEDSVPTPGARAALMLRQAKAAGEEQVAIFLATAEQMTRQAQEIADGGEVYPAGVRDICAKLIEHVSYRTQAVSLIMRP